MDRYPRSRSKKSISPFAAFSCYPFIVISKSLNWPATHSQWNMQTAVKLEPIFSNDPFDEMKAFYTLLVHSTRRMANLYSDFKF